jgi:hypothetical protein
MQRAVVSRRYQATPFKADTDFAFAHPETGMRLGADRYAVLLRKALEKQASRTANGSGRSMTHAMPP